jgi:pimeloyl-ACP methyl ester carboxylesterase
MGVSVNIEADQLIDHPWPEPRRLFVLAGDLRLSVLDWEGDRRPLLLLHGVGGNAWTWGPVAAALKRVRRPIALDLRGYGDSQWSRDHCYRTEDHASDLAHVAAALGLGGFDIAGFSWGGLIGLAFAAAHPEMVGRLVMIDVPPSSTLPEDAIPPNFRGRYEDHRDAVEGERELAPRAEPATLAALAAVGTRPDDHGALVRKMDPHLMSRWPFRSDNRWDEVRNLQVPTLVVRAGDSPVFSAVEAAAMGESPAVEVATVPDAGHLVVAERPQALAGLILDFLGT